MEDQNIITYRQALQALWDVLDAMPNTASPEYPIWEDHYMAQRYATNETRKELAASIGESTVIKITLEEQRKHAEAQLS